MVKKNFTRKDLSNKIYQILGFSKNFSSEIIDNFFETLINEIIKSNKIKLSSFGTFKVINKKKRIGRNPKTKEEAVILPRKIVKSSPSGLVKQKLYNSPKHEYYTNIHSIMFSKFRFINKINSDYYCVQVLCFFPNSVLRITNVY